MTERQMPKLNYDERQAFALVRKTIRRRPELAAALMEDMSKEVAVSILLKAKDELDCSLAVTRAFMAAAGEIAKNPKLILVEEKP
jgi:hypothetical protein